MLKSRQVILAKVETTYNTDAIPSAATDAVMCENVKFSYANTKMIARDAVVRASLGKVAPVYGGALGQITLDVEVRGSGAAGTAPEMSALLQACGLAETIVAATSVTYKPTSSDLKSCTVYFYDDGKLLKLTGCLGDANFDFTAGAKGKVSFTLTGHVGTPSDTALASATYGSTVPAPFINAGFSINAYAASISALKFGLGNKVAVPPSVNGADGFGQLRITGRSVTGSIDPEDVLVAAHDFVNEWTSGAHMALATGAIGSSAGNLYSVSMPAVVYNDAPGHADRDGISTLDLKFMATESIQDDELSIIFT